MNSNSFCQNALLVAPGAARVDLNIGTSERDLRTANGCSRAPSDGLPPLAETR
jgi:hypothetical protein